MNTIPFPGHRRRKCALAVLAVAVLCTAATWAVTWCTADFEVSPTVARHVLSNPGPTSAEHEDLQRASLIALLDDTFDAIDLFAAAAGETGPNAAQARAGLEQIALHTAQAIAKLGPRK